LTFLVTSCHALKLSVALKNSCVVLSSLGKKSVASSDMSCRWQR